MSRCEFYIFVLILCNFGHLKCHANQDQADSKAYFKDLTDSTWNEVSEKNQRFLIILCKDDNQDCRRIQEFFRDYPIPAGFSGELNIFQSTDSVLANKLGITDFPAVVFYRDNSPVPYDGELDDEDFSQWLLQAQDLATQILTDDTFEHLTQAVTGSTTGDWLVLFYKDSCPICKPSLTAFETVGVRLKGKLNVAKVNMEDCPKLVERFSLVKCPSIIYFRHGTMYRYDMEKVSVKILMSFVESWYRNMKAEKIPFEPTAFDKVTEDIALFIKKQIHGPNGKIILAGAGGVAALLFLLIICCCCCRKSPSKQKTQ